ncbi:hypothetical protein NBE99_07690 [Thermosynechococcus sp. HN-54]|uniref:PD-(D/E)XK nuclease domain-containing protein n=1 Tax=Thermosynechococcus sp. HN-54 TaxID=2933959 RepID=UPI00202CBB88|nr:hypothetical protein [Thermosynechococcus sp. HN-54]URR34528.1 hypothetical protein NBE99_07690 [Thermosynechococcus sp. HN-54]
MAVLAGLGCAGVGIGYGNMAVATGGVSISLGAAWFSIRENQQALLSQQPQRAFYLSDERDVALDHCKQKSIDRIISVYKIIILCKNFHSKAHSQLPSSFKEQHVQDVLEKLLKDTFPNSNIKREHVVPRPYPNGWSKIDFILKCKACGIEVKITSNGKKPSDNAKEIFNELAEDIEGYRPLMRDVKYLIFFIYDPYNKLQNPCGFENDLSGDRGGFEVITIVAQNPTLVAQSPTSKRQSRKGGSGQSSSLSP